MVSVKFPNRDIYFRESIWLVRQEVNNNRSLVHWQVWADDNDPYTNFSDGIAHRWLDIGSTRVLLSQGNGFSFGARGNYLLNEGDHWVNHAADGTASNIPIRGQANFDILGQTPLIVSSITLPTIPRASTATFSGGSSFDAGAAVTINTNRASTAFTHTIKWYFGTANGTVATGVGASYAWTPALTMLQQIPTATSGNGHIRVETYSGSTLIGTKDTAFTLRAGSAIVPSINPLTGTDTNPTVSSVVGAYVQGLSRVKVGATASGNQGSTITATEITVEGVRGSTSTSFALPTSGTRTLSAKVTDSRGRTATRTGTISVLAYTPPSSSSSNARRSTSSGTVNSGQSYIRVDLNATVKSLVNGSERNGMTIKIRTRATGGGWVNRNTITAALSYNSNFVVSGGAVFPPTSSFDVEITVTDNVGQTWVRIISLPTEAVTLDLNGTNVGIGKFHERGTLDVAGIAYISSHLYVEGNLNLSGTMTNGTVPVARLGDLSAGLSITTSPPVVGDADLASTPGFYILSSSGANNPIPGQEVSLQVIGTSLRQTQIATRIFGLDAVYKRYRSGSPVSWGSWFEVYNEQPPQAVMVASGNLAVTNNTDFNKWTTTGRGYKRGSITTGATKQTITVAGRYDVFVSMVYPNGTGTFVGAFRLQDSTGAVLEDFQKATPLLSSFGQTTTWDLPGIALNVGDQLSFNSVLGSGTIGNSQQYSTRLSIRYVGAL